MEIAHRSACGKRRPRTPGVLTYMRTQRCTELGERERAMPGIRTPPCLSRVYAASCSRKIKQAPAITIRGVSALSRDVPPRRVVSSDRRRRSHTLLTHAHAARHAMGRGHDPPAGPARPLPHLLEEVAASFIYLSRSCAHATIRPAARLSDCPPSPSTAASQSGCGRARSRL